MIPQFYQNLEQQQYHSNSAKMSSQEESQQTLPQRISPLTIDELKPFPLPKQLNSLPNKTFDQFIENKELIKSYLQDLETFKLKLKQINENIDLIINETLTSKIKNDLIPKYQNLIIKINNQIKTINQLYNEFLNYETIQYQLISSNFNQDILKLKFKKLIEQNNQDSLLIIKNFNKLQSANDNNIDEFNEMLSNFRESRKLYHFRKEKLNRWNEERVSGFI
ncbi:hypothetical protein KGF54_002837 [Candida jiufengensis]|uniref:uncharacterized protein n=1 Tax=Candida jiufengensis TaxID=497108 RepID=UPI0022255DD0|nr:uncharacterized protein KGF54_002837 [Candida jiufengensis]KAI5953465.1 hypothetical protein KGF54_002837 [Candida jiufengensis]